MLKRSRVTLFHYPTMHPGRAAAGQDIDSSIEGSKDHASLRALFADEIATQLLTHDDTELRAIFEQLREPVFDVVRLPNWRSLPTSSGTPRPPPGAFAVRRRRTDRVLHIVDARDPSAPQRPPDASSFEAWARSPGHASAMPHVIAAAAARVGRFVPRVGRVTSLQSATPSGEARGKRAASPHPPRAGTRSRAGAPSRVPRR